MVTDSSGQMYGAAYDAVYSIDPTVPSATYIVGTGCCDPGAPLVILPGGQAYLARADTIFTIDLTTGAKGSPVTITGDIGSGVRSMAYMNGKVYCINNLGSGGSGIFAEIDPVTGVLTNIGGSGSWYGLASTEAIT
jgi:hypothetical protein